MSNVLAPVPRQRTFTDLGVVAPGALLHTYVSGTPSTPLATTSDAAGLVPNANPIVASAGGLFGPIYLTPGLAYHFVLTDAAGLAIWDQDPVAGGGTSPIVFPPTQVPSSDPNTLDDYREGAWTPLVAFGGSTAGFVYSLNVGRYVKIGRLVHVYGRVILTTKGSATGGAAIYGLPVTVEGTINAFPGAIAFPIFGGLALAVTGLTGLAVPNTVSFNLQSMVPATSTIQVDHTYFSNTTDLSFAGTYMAAT